MQLVLNTGPFKMPKPRELGAKQLPLCTENREMFELEVIRKLSSFKVPLSIQGSCQEGQTLRVE